MPAGLRTSSGDFAEACGFLASTQTRSSSWHSKCSRPMMFFALLCSLPVGPFLKEKNWKERNKKNRFCVCQTASLKINSIVWNIFLCCLFTRKLFTSAGCNLCGFGLLDLETIDSECLENNLSYHMVCGRMEGLEEQGHLEAQRKEIYVQKTITIQWHLSVILNSHAHTINLVTIRKLQGSKVMPSYLSRT